MYKDLLAVLVVILESASKTEIIIHRQGMFMKFGALLRTYLRDFSFNEVGDNYSLFDSSVNSTSVEASTIAGISTSRYINEFSTSKQRQAGSIHEISYRACFKPQLPRFFIELLIQEGDLVYDPFSGSGTTVIEAGLLGRNVVSNDINPLSMILICPRFDPPSVEEVEARLLCTLPPNQAVSPESQRKINETRNQTPEYHSTKDIIVRKMKTLLRSLTDIERANLRNVGKLALYLHCESDSTGDIKAASVKLTVTSPPFFNIVQYSKDNWMRCWFNSLDAEEIGGRISLSKTPATWIKIMRLWR